MRRVFESVVARIDLKVRTFNPKTIYIQIGRTAIALSQLLTLLLTSWENLTPEIVDTPQTPVCDSVFGASLFCIGDSHGAVWQRLVAIAILLLVCGGIFPRYTSILHAWVSFSMALSMGLPDGGEQVAQVTTVLICLMMLSDNRAFAWKVKDVVVGPNWASGISFAAWWVLRLQMAGIYLESGLSKIGVPDWVNGTAMYYVVRDPSFGASGTVGTLLRWITSMPVGTAFLSWGTIVFEVTIAVLLLRSKKYRVVALVFVVSLHMGIIIAIGLWSFGLIMIGAVLVASNIGGPRNLVDRDRNLPQSGAVSSEVSAIISNGSEPRENDILVVEASR